MDSVFAERTKDLDSTTAQTTDIIQQCSGDDDSIVDHIRDESNAEDTCQTGLSTSTYDKRYTFLTCLVNETDFPACSNERGKEPEKSAVNNETLIDQAQYDESMDDITSIYAAAGDDTNVHDGNVAVSDNESVIIDRIQYVSSAENTCRTGMNATTYDNAYIFLIGLGTT